MRHRTAAGALCLSFLAPMAPAQDGMELQRCIWRCLSEFGPNTSPAYNQCVAERCTEPQPAQQQGWGDLHGLMTASFGLVGTAIPGEGNSFWLPDHVDPAQATTALGVLYWIPQNGGNSFRISVGVFERSGSGFALSRPVPELFGHDPRDAVFAGDTIELTTTMPRDGDPRCCPTGEVRWSVDRATGAVTRLSGP